MIVPDCWFPAVVLVTVLTPPVLVLLVVLWWCCCEWWWWWREVRGEESGEAVGVTLLEWRGE